MVARRVSEDFSGFLANASDYQATRFKNGFALEGRLREVALVLPGRQDRSIVAK